MNGKIQVYNVYNKIRQLNNHIKTSQPQSINFGKLINQHESQMNQSLGDGVAGALHMISGRKMSDLGYQNVNPNGVYDEARGMQISNKTAMNRINNYVQTPPKRVKRAIKQVRRDFKVQADKEPKSLQNREEQQQIDKTNHSGNDIKNENKRHPNMLSRHQAKKYESDNVAALGTKSGSQLQNSVESGKRIKLNPKILRIAERLSKQTPGYRESLYNDRFNYNSSSHAIHGFSKQRNNRLGKHQSHRLSHVNFGRNNTRSPKLRHRRNGPQRN